MELYQWYIIISVLLIILEIFVSGFVLLPIGLAGLCTAVVAYFRPELWLHGVFFICGSGLAVIALAKLRENINRTTPAGAMGPVGQVGIVVALPTVSGGFQVKIFGDTWEVLESKQSQDQEGGLEVGSRVRVTGVSGNKILIEKI
jgi:membrane protein implicated in regulation of membrane protease activity